MLDLNKLYAEAMLLDALIAKALKVSQLAQIANKEKKLRKYLLLTWNKRAQQAIAKATALAKKIKDADKIIEAITSIMNDWEKDIKEIVSAEIKSIYKLGRAVAKLKASGKIKSVLRYGIPVKKADAEEIGFALDLVDEEAIESLINHQLYWIGKHYDDNVSNTIAAIVKDKMIESGGDPIEAGRLINDALTAYLGVVITPDGFHGTAEQYFEGLAANVATNARVFGQMRSFSEVGVTTYTIVNPMDERTCERCAMLEGIPFSTKDGIAQMERMLSAKTPDEVKAIHPWLSASKFKEIAGNLPKGKLGAAFMSEGVAFPPYHFKCRCTVDVETSSMGYESLD